MKRRFVYLSDTHLRSSRPSCRLDKGYYENQLEKWREVLQIASDHADGIIVHGGDLFHTHNSAISLLVDVCKSHNKFNEVTLYSNVGNHDCDGHVDTVWRSGLGLLHEYGLLSMPMPFISPVSGAVLKSEPYMISYPEEFYQLPEQMPGVIKMAMAHDYLTTRWVPFDHREIKDLKTNADIVLCSHWHSQFIERVGSTLFVNSGPLDAQKTTERHIKPAVVIVEVDNGKVDARFHYLKTTGYEEIEVKEEEEKDLGLADGFVEELQKSNLADGADIHQAIRVVAKESGYSDSLIERVMKRVKDSQICVEA